MMVILGGIVHLLLGGTVMYCKGTLLHRSKLLKIRMDMLMSRTEQYCNLHVQAMSRRYHLDNTMRACDKRSKVGSLGVVAAAIALVPVAGPQTDE